MQSFAYLMHIMRKYLLTFLLVTLTTLGAYAADQFPNISTDELKNAITKKEVVLLDVNGSSSWKNGHIPGALDFKSVEKDLASKLPADKSSLIVAYCGNEKCGAYRAAALAAKKLGYTNVKHYSKGIQGWIKEGQSTAKPVN